ncbi:heme exporter protein CcmD [bacterium]|nr:heme exporter protein CcmD [bacterium]
MLAHFDASGFIIAAYAITLLGIAALALRTIWRYRHWRGRATQLEKP